MRWLDTVKFDKLHGAMVMAAVRVEVIFQSHQVDLWITSGNDSTHLADSKHYEGKALDFRIHNVPTTDLKNTILAEVKAALGPMYFCQIEDINQANEHLHVQYNGI